MKESGMKKSGIKRVYKFLCNKAYLGFFAGYIFMSSGAFADPLRVKITGENEFREIQLPDPSIITKECIDEAPFSREAITKVVIPSSVKIIDKYAFISCKSLKSINFESGNQLREIREGAFDACDKLTRIVIPANVEVIDKYAFWSCSSLVFVIFEQRSRLVTIGEYAFAGTNLTGMVIPASVKIIGKGGLSCNALNYVIFEPGSQLIEIKESAFSGAKLTRIIIPASVKAISNNAFWACPLREIYVPIHFSDENKESFLNRLGISGDRSTVVLKTTP